MAEFELKKAETGPTMTNGQLWDAYTESQPHIVDALSNCLYILLIIYNGSGMDIWGTLTALYNSSAEFILDCLEKCLHPVDVNSIHPQHLVVENCLGIIHNFCKKHVNAIVDLREKKALQIIGKYRNSGTVTLKTKSILTYSYLISEDDDKNKAVIELEESDVKFLISVLRDALDSPGEPSKKSGYHADELIFGLNNIAVVDSNKKRLVDAGVLPLYVEAMAGKKPELQEYAARGIWTLAFDSESMKKIKEEPGCMEELRKLAKLQKDEIKSAAKGALWKLEKETKLLQVISTKSKQSFNKPKLAHIMISYQWDVQEEVLRVRQRLKSEGYRVWIDTEQMTGDTLESMAKAVENAAILVPVLTEKYKASVACRQELSYANQLKKKMVPIRLQSNYNPNGWLGILLSSTFYYDLTNCQTYETKMVDFIKAIGEDAKVKLSEGETPMCEGDDVDDVDSTNTKTMFKVTKLRCVEWTKDRVSEWLKHNNLEKYVEKFAGMDGRLLAELAAVQLISPDVYYPMMKQEHGMPMIDILKMNAALRELNPA